ncbi:MAG: hypothetical protein V1763_00985 [Parcubacteria group bacterium]
MRKLLKFTGIGLAAAAIILLLVVGYANGKRFLTRTSYKDCPSYIFVVAETMETKPDMSVLQEKINTLKIGDVILKPEGENKVLILVQSNNNLTEAEHQAVVAVLKELGLQEIEMGGSGNYRAKICNSGDDLIKRNP